MTTRDQEERDLEDLVARARRGDLSRTDQAALETALADSAELDTAYRIGVEMDRETAVRAGDDALIARAADAALTRAETMTGRTLTPKPAARAQSHNLMRWAAAAVLMLSMFASGIATAWWNGVTVTWPFRIEGRKAEVFAPQGDQAEPKKLKARAKRARGAPAPMDTPAPAPTPTAVLEAAPLEPAVIEETAAASSARKASVSTLTAAELFHDANDARRGGESQRARRLYGKLIDQHPDSDEAGLARVSLGKLLLSAGDARGAEREYRRYLAMGKGQLAEEALVGQAQSLHRLHRDREEHSAWQRLLAAYPRSVYAAQAKQRIAQLDGLGENAHEGPP